MNKLLRDVQKLSSKGLKDNDVINQLSDAGWPNNEIKVAIVEMEMIKQNVKVPYKRLEKLEIVIEKMMKNKVPKDEVERILIKKGWPKKIVDGLINNVR